MYCKVNHFTSYLTVTTSVLTLLALTFDRHKVMRSANREHCKYAKKEQCECANREQCKCANKEHCNL